MERDPHLVVRRGDATTLNFQGKKVAIVGGTGGIGRAFGQFLAARGASVISVGQTFRDSGVPGITFLHADLSDMREARRVGITIPAESLDLVLLTTRIFAAPRRQETPDGLERDLAVSYLSRFVIVRQIGERLGTERSAAPLKPRVFVWGYPGSGMSGDLSDLNSERSYRALPAHMNTVADNEELVLDSSNIRSNMVGDHPVRYRFFEGMIGVMAPSVETYTCRIAPLRVAPELESHSGAMFDRKGFAVFPSSGIRRATYRTSWQVRRRCSPG